MEMKFSDGTMEHLIKHYPWMNEETFNRLLGMSEVKPKKIEPEIMELYEGQPIIYRESYEMILPIAVAIEFNLEYRLDLIPDKDGVIYYKYE